MIDPGPDLPEHVSALLAGLAGESRRPYPDHPYPSRPFPGGRGPAGGHRRADLWLRSPWPLWRHRANPAPTSPSPPTIGWATGMASRGRAGGWRRCIPPAMPPTISVSLLPQERALFSGDHVMGWSTTVVAPPDGDMAAYMRSLAKLRRRGDEIYLADPWRTDPRSEAPYRGADRASPGAAPRRAGRSDGAARDAGRLVGQVYPGLDPRLTGAAAQSLLAHLIELGAGGPRPRNQRVVVSPGAEPLPAFPDSARSIESNRAQLESGS